MEDRFESAPWPGNVRELAHTREHLVLVSEEQLSDSWSPGAVSEERVAGPGAASHFDFASGDCTLEAVERRLVQACLDHTDGNVSEAARLLGVSRGALRHRMEKWIE